MGHVTVPRNLTLKSVQDFPRPSITKSKKILTYTLRFLGCYTFNNIDNFKLFKKTPDQSALKTSLWVF